MSIFTYHLVKVNIVMAIHAHFFSLKSRKIDGLIHAEVMNSMTLGAAIFSTSRMKLEELVVFAQWENEAALDSFLTNDYFGGKLAKGWHVRMIFMRQWGAIKSFEIPKEIVEPSNEDVTVVAVTIARMKLLAVPRFLKWGRPVEKLVRDHPGTRLSLASIRLPNTVSTFSIWNSIKEMTDMVQGHSKVPLPKRHIEAMNERERKDFHFEFTTLRFIPIAEYGKWNGCDTYLPSLH